MSAKMDNSSESETKRLTAVLDFAKLYRDCVESFNLIHQGKKEWNRNHRLLMVKVGIEQAKLLAWSQSLGVCELGEYRDSRLDDPSIYQQITSIVKCMLDRLVNVDHGVQLATYGLKPSKKASELLEPALDSTRLESFREQYMMLPNAEYGSWEKSTHWTISDESKFGTYVTDTRHSVTQLIELMGVESHIEESVKQDIKAMGWHPVFDRVKAANDGSKLRLIKEGCKDDAPVFSTAANVPLAYLNTQWADSYQEFMDMNYPQGSTIKTQLNKSGLIEEAKEKKFIAGETSLKKPSLSSIFLKLRSHSWHKRSSVSIDSLDPPRSKSLAHPSTSTEEEDNKLCPERSKSEGGGSSSQNIAFANPFSLNKAVMSSQKTSR